MITLTVDDFATWRAHARRALREGLTPDDILWTGTDSSQAMLPLATPEPNEARAPTSKHVNEPASSLRVPRRFVDLARMAACHRDTDRWSLLYRLLWRLLHQDRLLLDHDTDADVHAVSQMAAQVKRDEHKMRAFVRFHKTSDEQGERFVAWYRPDHLIVRLAAPFFADRFSSMRWSILTPDLCAHWDGQQLSYSAGVENSTAMTDSEVEELWRTYYAAVFNPARVNVSAMQREMPRRRWTQLPEGRVIRALVSSAPARVMALDASELTAPSARPLVPATRDLDVLREAAATCQGCDLHRHATQTVFGEGPAGRMMLIGEQPGDSEDLKGRPFVGPAGQVLDRACAAAGLDRASAYLTNAVKHFSFEPRGKWRIHKKPRLSEVRACRPWVEAEIHAVRPTCIVCLGATAAQSLLGPQVQVMQARGRVITGTAWAPKVIVTIHPSAVLRADEGERYFALLVEDLRLAASEI